MIVNTSKLAGLQRRRESLHAVFRDASRQLDEARQILSRLENRTLDIRTGRTKDDLQASLLANTAAAKADVIRLTKLRDDAARDQTRYLESTESVIRWAEDEMKRPGYRPVMPTIGDGR